MAKGEIIKGIASIQNRSTQQTPSRASLFKDNDLFGVNKKIPIGPGQYQVNDDLMFKTTPHFSMATKSNKQSISLKKQMESYLGAILGNEDQYKIRTSTQTSDSKLSDKPMSSLISKTIRHDPTMQS